MSASGIPSMDALRSWRAKNRDISYRKEENNSAAKLRDECLDHVATIAIALQEIEEKHGVIFHDADRVWNMDETSICTEAGKVVKVLSGVHNHHGGFTGVVN